MNVLPLLYRNIKWRYHNAFTIVITILQPMIWLVLYSAIAGQSMKGAGIENYTAFILPGLIVLVCFSSCSSGGIMNYLMKADGSFYRVLIAPIRRSSIVLGQILEAILCSLLETAIMITAGLFFSVRIASGPAGILLIILLVFISAFFMAGLAYAISLILPNEVVYETAMNAIVLPAFFLSTALFPAGSLTGILAVLVNLNPLTHVINALRQLILEPVIIYQDVFRAFALLALMSMVSFSWALHRLLRLMKQ